MNDTATCATTSTARSRWRPPLSPACDAAVAHGVRQVRRADERRQRAGDDPGHE